MRKILLFAAALFAASTLAFPAVASARRATSAQGTMTVTGSVWIRHGSEGYAVAACPDGYVLVSGGYSAPAGFDVDSSFPFLNEWVADAHNDTSKGGRLVAVAYCSLVS